LASGIRLVAESGRQRAADFEQYARIADIHHRMAILLAQVRARVPLVLGAGRCSSDLSRWSSSIIGSVTTSLSRITEIQRIAPAAGLNS